MIRMEEKLLIREMHYNKGISIRGIHRQLGRHRGTIRKALADSSEPCYKKVVAYPRPVLGPFCGFIDSILIEDSTKAKKIRHTAKRIYDRLGAEYGYKGAYITVKKYVQKKKMEFGINVKEVYIPIAHPFGEECEVDWTEVIVGIRGTETLAQIFNMRPCSSGKIFACAFPHQRQEAFFEGHIRGFEYFRGVWKRIIYDNLSTAVKKILHGRRREEQLGFMQFRTHHLFEAHFCNPSRGNEKGGVENAGGYVKRNFFVPRLEVNSFEELNERLLIWCIADSNRSCKRLGGRSPESVYQEEKAQLLPLPQYRFDCCRTVGVKVNSLSQVVFEQNRYSVPVRYAYMDATLKAYVDRVVVGVKGEVIAQHKRCYETGKEIYDPVHYLPLLDKKPGALDCGRPFVGWRLPPVWERFRGKVGLKSYIRILQEIVHYGEEKITQVLNNMIDTPNLSPDMILRVLENGRGSLKVNIRGELAVEIPQISLERYDMLVNA